MQSRNEIKTRRIGPVVLLDIKGDITKDSDGPLREAYAETDREGAQRILLKFNRNAYFNSEGIKVMIELLADIKRHRRQAGITGLSKHFRKIFGMVGIARLATVYDSNKQAFESLGIEPE